MISSIWRWFQGATATRPEGGSPACKLHPAAPCPWPLPPAVDQQVRDTVRLAVRPETPLVCTDCKLEGLATYYLKRRRGLYALLCFQGGQGCWERSARTNCSYTDTYGADCTFLAEFEIVSLDGDSSRRSCLGHVPLLLTPGSSGQEIFPLED